MAKKQAVEEALHNRGRKTTTKQQAPQHKQPPKAAPVSAKSNFSSLLDQINNERERLEHQGPESSRSVRSKASATIIATKIVRNVHNDQRSQDARGNKKNKKQRKGFEPSVPELEAQADTSKGEDRYAQMAVQAEKLQRDKVLAEARAAVEAASHDLVKVVGDEAQRGRSVRLRLVNVLRWRHWKRA